MQDINNLIVKDDLVAIARRSKENSCSSERIKVSGEYYVTKNPKRKKKIDMFKIKIAVLAGATVALVALGSKVIGNNDFVTDIRHEAGRTQNVFNVVGGNYETKYVYGDNFVDYIKDLSDKELMELYEQTATDMREDGLLDESGIQREVISSMQHDYMESLSKGSK